MSLHRILLITLASVPLLSAQTAPAGETWPMELDDHGFHLVIYQPQVDSWKQNRLEGRAAVTATKTGSAPGSTQEAFGIVTLSARTDVDKESRLVALEDIKVTSASFPGAKPAQGDLEKPSAIRSPTGPRPSRSIVCSPISPSTERPSKANPPVSRTTLPRSSSARFPRC